MNRPDTSGIFYEGKKPMSQHTTFIKLKTSQEPKLRLLCFPYAGGGTATFVPYAKSLPNHVELWVIQPPGKCARIKEAPYETMAPLVEEICQAWLGSPDVPSVFWGHSLGSRIALEFTHQLSVLGAPLPVGFIASGSKCPRKRAIASGITSLTDRDFVQRVRQIGGMEPQIAEHEELLSLVLPGLKADFRIAETYTYIGSSGLPLSVPLCLFSGRHDSLAPSSEMAGWRSLFEHCVESRIFEGDHFFIDHQIDDVAKALNYILNQALELLASCSEC
ncbi:putative Gramicidin S biosynthesis protein grsT [Vibrio chagasii]|uniref:thioesterase II family protein n=1 Tax=Vibrio chagasii TaxID=170679 RepID=UPI0033745187|nr:putative Gramicidin S biosynthesis protein grsT [Vibrio chagasii]